jgi:erythronate-4-phosphate dehydrogenase
MRLPLRIVADENIPLVREAFSAFGEVETLPGRAITPEQVKDADALLVRSITRVDRNLLNDSKVAFVGTATIGTDHVDTDYLRERGTAFASAPGCNANSVAEYVVAALLQVQHHHGIPLRRCSLGIIGVGHVGGKVRAKAEALGMHCVCNDPPLAERTGDPQYRPLEEAIACDFVTLHVPLEHAGPCPTYRLAGVDFFERIRPSAILINTARGAVVDSLALLAALETGRVHTAILDVWENEPTPPQALVERAFIATPHIAGYSYDGKVNGTRQLYEALRRQTDSVPPWSLDKMLPPAVCPEIRVDSQREDALLVAVSAVYDIMRDDAAFRAAMAGPKTERGALFDRLRKDYPTRREFMHTHVRTVPPSTELDRTLAGLGFKTGA